MASRASCVFFAQGRCREGASCRFAHDGVRPICVFYSTKGCNNGAACPFRHEGRPAPPPAERKRLREEALMARQLEQLAAHNREEAERKKKRAAARAAEVVSSQAVTCELCGRKPRITDIPCYTSPLSGKCGRCNKTICWCCAWDQFEDFDPPYCRPCFSATQRANCGGMDADKTCSVCSKNICAYECEIHSLWIDHDLCVCKRCWKKRPPIDFAVRRFGAAPEDDALRDALGDEHGSYDEDLPTPPIVSYAENGQLDRVRAIVERATQRSPEFARAVVNATGAWQEVEEKWGYDKSWEWHGQTALAKECRSKHHAVVHYLLGVGADPFLEAMVNCDQSEDAFKAAEHFPSLDGYEATRALLAAAKPFWRGDVGAQSFRYSRRLNYRVPTDAAALRLALDAAYAPYRAYAPRQRGGGGAYYESDDDDDDDDDDDPDDLEGVDWSSVGPHVRRHMEARQLARAAYAARTPRSAAYAAAVQELKRGRAALAGAPPRQAKTKRKRGGPRPKGAKRKKRRGQGS